MTARPYQARIFDQVAAALSEVRTVCLQSGTGSGKTFMAAEILKRAVARGYCCLFLAHLDTLVEDTHERLTEAGVHAGFVQAGRVATPDAPVQVASVATVHSRGLRPRADLIIPDECHRGMSRMWQGVFSLYPDAAILGLSATPQRADGRALGDTFDRLIIGPTNRELVRDGYLVPCDVLAPPMPTEGGLAMDPVDAYVEHTPGQRAIVFAANIAHAEDLCARFATAGYPAACIIGETSRDDRRRVREALTEGTLRVVVGVSVFLEGWDVPCIEVVILARPFSHVGGFLQAIGRGLRPSLETGKTRCTALDLRGAVNLHGLPEDDRIWSLSGAACVLAEALPALARCSSCLAVFRPRKTCPRCGADVRAEPKIPRVLSRAEKLANVSRLPRSEQDRRYLAAMARRRRDLEWPAAWAWAKRKFFEVRGRLPEVA